MRNRLDTKKRNKKPGQKQEAFIRIRVSRTFKTNFAALAELRMSTESQIARDALIEYLERHGINLEEVSRELAQIEAEEAASVSYAGSRTRAVRGHVAQGQSK